MELLKHMKILEQLVIGVLGGIIIVLAIALINAPAKINENDILYNRFKVESVIHDRLIIAIDMQTNKKYWLFKDIKWLVSAPYKESE